jgi:hypothetical protein
VILQLSVSFEQLSDSLGVTKFRPLNPKNKGKGKKFIQSYFDINLFQILQVQVLAPLDENSEAEEAEDDLELKPV